MQKITSDKATGYDWNKARQYNKDKRKGKATGTPRAATNGNA